MAKQPLAEVFGFPLTNMSKEACRHRENRLCRFNNKVPNCTKDKANNPLGVCSLTEDGEIIVTCPVRFRQNWIIADDAAHFFFPIGTTWTTLTEVRLKDKNGNAAGNIDVVLVSYDNRGKVTGFGGLEVQAVYISGNVRNPFEHYMENPKARQNMDWAGHPNYPHADYLSSSRKRLAPQLIFKGGIFKTWERRTAVALNSGFFSTLPELEEVAKDDADVAWLIYDLVHDSAQNIYTLTKSREVFTKFNESLEKITRSEAGDVNTFIEMLQEKVNTKLETPPDTETIDAVL
jgi:Restriction endonuclease NotI